MAYAPNLVWHTSYTEVYSGFIQSLDADTGILDYFNLDHNCFCNAEREREREREKLTKIWFMFEILELVVNFGKLYV